VLDGAVEVEVEVGAEAEAAPVTTVDDADAEDCPVAVDPVARTAGGVGVVVPGAFSFCARFVALPKPRNLPIIPLPGVPGVAAPFPVAPVPDPLSSGVAGTAAATAAGPGPPLDTDGRRVGAVTSSFCATTFDVVAVLAVMVPPLEAP
jgi:hypothetical protein